MNDLTVEFIKVLDVSNYQRDGSLMRQREYVFFIGKRGPFTERVPLEPFDATEIERRVSKLKIELQSLPT